MPPTIVIRGWSLISWIHSTGLEGTGRAIFLKDLEGLDWADGVVAIMDGPDPDSGTAWECGYAYARRIPVVLFRSDLRASSGVPDIPYNAMLIGAADAHIVLPLATLDDAARAILAALGALPPSSSGRTAPSSSGA